MVAVAWSAIGLLTVYLFVSTYYLKGKIDSLDARLSARIDALDAHLSARIDALAGRLDAHIDGALG